MPPLSGKELKLSCWVQSLGIWRSAAGMQCVSRQVIPKFQCLDIELQILAGKASY